MRDQLRKTVLVCYLLVLCFVSAPAICSSSSFSSSTSSYFVAEPITATTGQNRSTVLALADATKNTLHFYADIPNNAARFLLSITPQRASEHPSSTMNVLLRRQSPAFISTPPSSSDVTACNATQATLTGYRCTGLTIDVLPSMTNPPKYQILLLQPKGGRYFLSLTASRGVIDFAWSLTWTECPSNAAPDATGECRPVQLLPQNTNIHLDAGANAYYYVLPSSIESLVALSVNYTTADTDLCGSANTGPRIYLREAGMANPSVPAASGFALDAYDVSLPCAASTAEQPYVQWWLAPSSSQVFFLAAHGGLNGFDFKAKVASVSSPTLCGSSKTTGVRCSTSLSGQAMCPVDSVTSCFSSLTSLSGSKSQSASIKFSASQTWSFASVKIDSNELFTLDIVVRANSDQIAALKKGETWQIVANYDTIPNIDASNASTSVRYPLSAVAVIGSLTQSTPILTLSIPYPKQGTWVFGLKRTPATPGFGEDPDISAVTVVFAVSQSKCPNSCSGRGTCDEESHTCTCKFGYTAIDCSDLSNSGSKTKDGLGLGLGFTLPIIGLLVLAAVGYVWWRETVQSNYEMA